MPVLPLPSYLTPLIPDFVFSRSSSFLPSSCSGAICYLQVVTQEFRCSASEKGPTPRSLAGNMWQHFAVQKILYGVFPDGSRKVLRFANAAGVYFCCTV